MKISKVVFGAGLLLGTSALAYADDFTVTDAQTTQNGGNVIDGADSLIIEAAGSITTSSDDTAAVLANGDDNVVINDGTLSANNIGSDGINAGERAMITNSGMINAANNGIETKRDAIITNSGTVMGTVAGIDVDSFATITNTGAIIGGSKGIQFDSKNGTVDNAGLIQGGTQAIDFRGAGNVLTVRGASDIRGEIDLSTGTSVNAVTGNGHNAMYDLSTGTLVGTPTISGDGIAVFDAAAKTLLVMDTETLSRSMGETARVQQRSLDVVGTQIANVAGGAISAGATAFNGGRRLSGRNAGAGFQSLNSVWVTGFIGGEEKTDSAATVGYETDNQGVIAGADMRLEDGNLLGAFAGYVEAELAGDITGVRTISSDQSGWLAGVYHQVQTATYRIDLIGLGGMLDHDNLRSINTMGGPVIAQGDHDSWWLSAEGAVFRPWLVVDGWQLEPGLRARYTYQNVDGYTETGVTPAIAATYGEYTPQFVEAMIEMRAIQADGDGNVTLLGGAGARQTLAGDDVTVTIGGTPNQVELAEKTVYRAYAGIDLQVPLAQMLDMSLNGQVSLQEAQGVTPSAFVTLRRKF